MTKTAEEERADVLAYLILLASAAKTSTIAVEYGQDPDQLEAFFLATAETLHAGTHDGKRKDYAAAHVGGRLMTGRMEDMIDDILEEK